ncbi:MAG: hypothetical protein LBR44_07930 [Clostridiales Family XIII bacterium]|jgi:hypothetical protein|nr:hypothetical protein [Clostridiales Family XIII bacterium]
MNKKLVGRRFLMGARAIALWLSLCLVLALGGVAAGYGAEAEPEPGQDVEVDIPAIAAEPEEEPVTVTVEPAQEDDDTPAPEGSLVFEESSAIDLGTHPYPSGGLLINPAFQKYWLRYEGSLPLHDVKVELTGGDVDAFFASDYVAPESFYNASKDSMGWVYNAIFIDEDQRVLEPGERGLLLFSYPIFLKPGTYTATGVVRGTQWLDGQPEGGTATVEAEFQLSITITKGNPGWYSPSVLLTKAEVYEGTTLADLKLPETNEAFERIEWDDPVDTSVGKAGEVNSFYYTIYYAGDDLFNPTHVKVDVTVTPRGETPGHGVTFEPSDGYNLIDFGDLLYTGGDEPDESLYFRFINEGEPMRDTEVTLTGGDTDAITIYNVIYPEGGTDNSGLVKLQRNPELEAGTYEVTGVVHGYQGPSYGEYMQVGYEPNCWVTAVFKIRFTVSLGHPPIPPDEFMTEASIHEGATLSDVDFPEIKEGGSFERFEWNDPPGTPVGEGGTTNDFDYTVYYTEKTGLKPTTVTCAITVVPHTDYLDFRVEPQGKLNIGSVTSGYQNAPVKAVTMSVLDVGNPPYTGAVTNVEAKLSGANPDAFTLVDTKLKPLRVWSSDGSLYAAGAMKPGDSRSILVRPKAGLAPGTYTAEVTLVAYGDEITDSPYIPSGWNFYVPTETKTVTVSFTVTKPARIVIVIQNIAKQLPALLNWLLRLFG